MYSGCYILQGLRSKLQSFSAYTREAQTNPNILTTRLHRRVPSLSHVAQKQNRKNMPRIPASTCATARSRRMEFCARESTSIYVLTVTGLGWAGSYWRLIESCRPTQHGGLARHVCACFMSFHKFVGGQCAMRGQKYCRSNLHTRITSH